MPFEHMKAKTLPPVETEADAAFEWGLKLASSTAGTKIDWWFPYWELREINGI